MSFTFRFEALLKVRAHHKEKAEISLGRARGSLREAREELEDLERARGEIALDLQRSIRRGTNGDTLKGYSDFLAARELHIAAQHMEIERREEIVRRRLEEVVVRTREYRIIEKLKEKDYKKWLREQNIQEQKVMDENAVIRHGRAFL